MSDHGRAAFLELDGPQQELVDGLAWDFEDAWKSGRRPAIDDAIREGRAASLGQKGLTALFYWLLRIDATYRRVAREVVAVGDYSEKFPEYAQLVTDFFSSSSESPPSVAPPRPPRGVVSAESPFQIPDYELLGKLGTGATGDVWLAWHLVMQRFEALKFLQGTPFVGEQGRQRFLQEVAALGQLDHRNVVRVFNAGSANGVWFVALEYLDGESLDKIHRRTGVLSPADACSLACEAARGLGHAHEKGIVHRDVTPANLLITREGTVKILDFGLAKWRRERSIGELETSEGYLLGTPGFMAPEQLDGRNRISFATDVYGLGATLYFLLTGQVPNLGKTWEEAVRQAMAGTPVQALRDAGRELDDGLCQAIDSMLHADPTQRMTSMQIVQDRLALYAKSADLARLVRTEEGESESAVDAAVRGNSRDEDPERMLAKHRAIGEPDPLAANPLPRAPRPWAWLAAGGGLLLVAFAAAFFLFTPVGRNSSPPAATDPAKGAATVNSIDGGPADLPVARNSEVSWIDVSPNWTYATVAPAAAVCAVDWSPDGEELAYGTKDGELRTCHSETLETIHRFDGERLDVTTLRWSPDGAKLAAASGYKLEIFSRSGELLLSSVTLHPIIDLDWHPRESKLAAIDKGGNVAIRDRDGNVLHEFVVDRYFGSNVAWTPDGRELITNGGEGTIKVWSDTGEPLQGIDFNSGGIARFACSRDGRLAVSSDRSRNCEIWDLASRSLWTEFDFPKPVQHILRWSPDGGRLLCLLVDRFQLYELNPAAAGERLRLVGDFPDLGNADCAAWHPRGTSFVVGGPALRICNLQGNVSRSQPFEVSTALWRMARNPTGDQLAISDSQGAVMFWTADGRLQHVLPAHERHVSGLAWSPDGEWLASGGDDGVVAFWTRAGERLKAFHEHTDRVNLISWSPSGQWLASGSHDKTVRLFHPQRDAGPVMRNEGTVISLAWSPDGGLLAAGLDGLIGIQVWKSALGFREFSLLQGMLRDHVGIVEFSPAGSRLAGGASYGSAAVWDFEMASGQKLAGLTENVLALAWHPLGKLVVASGGRECRFWDDQGRPRFTLDGFSKIQRLAWSPTGDWLAIGDITGNLTLVDSELQRGRFLAGVSGAISGVAWSEDGSRVTFCTNRGWIRGYDVVDNSIVFTALVLPPRDVLRFGEGGEVVEGDSGLLQGRYVRKPRSNGPQDQRGEVNLR